jgi:hypothetical protein
MHHRRPQGLQHHSFDLSREELRGPLQGLRVLAPQLGRALARQISRCAAPALPEPNPEIHREAPDRQRGTAVPEACGHPVPLQRSLEEAGYTDIKIMPESFLVRAKNRSGNPVLMIVNPDSITAITQFNSETGSSETTGSGAGAGERPVNSRARVRGLPGNKSGPAITSSGKTAKVQAVLSIRRSGSMTSLIAIMPHLTLVPARRQPGPRPAPRILHNIRNRNTRRFISSILPQRLMTLLRAIVRNRLPARCAPSVVE